MLRMGNGITQMQLREQIGKTQALISYIQKTGNANEDALQAIAKSLNITVEQIVNATDEGATKKFNQSLNKDALYKQLLSEIAYLKMQIENYKEIINTLSLEKKNNTTLEIISVLPVWDKAHFY